MVGVFPFGRPATERPPRPPVCGPADLFVLGVYPSALHVCWRRPDGPVRVRALAVDDEPEVFWDGADAEVRVERWRRAVGWHPSWGHVSSSMNGTSGQSIAKSVLAPLGVNADRVYFTDCVRRFFVKGGTNSQAEAIKTDYAPFAAARGLPAASLPSRPADALMVRTALDEDRGALAAQLHASGAGTVVTLGQVAADVFAALAGRERIGLRAEDESYGTRGDFRLGAVSGTWMALKHPGQRQKLWERRHELWAGSDPVL